MQRRAIKVGEEYAAKRRYFAIERVRVLGFEPRWTGKQTDVLVERLDIRGGKVLKLRPREILKPWATHLQEQAERLKEREARKAQEERDRAERTRIAETLAAMLDCNLEAELRLAADLTSRAVELPAEEGSLRFRLIRGGTYQLLVTTLVTEEQLPELARFLNQLYPAPEPVRV